MPVTYCVPEPACIASLKRQKVSAKRCLLAQPKTVLSFNVDFILLKLHKKTSQVRAWNYLLHELAMWKYRRMCHLLKCYSPIVCWPVSPNAASWIRRRYNCARYRLDAAAWVSIRSAFRDSSGMWFDWIIFFCFSCNRHDGESKIRHRQNTGILHIDSGEISTDH